MLPWRRIPLMKDYVTNRLMVWLGCSLFSSKSRDIPCMTISFEPECWISIDKMSSTILLSIVITHKASSCNTYWYSSASDSSGFRNFDSFLCFSTQFYYTHCRNFSGTSWTPWIWHMRMSCVGQGVSEL